MVGVDVTTTNSVVFCQVDDNSVACTYYDRGSFALDTIDIRLAELFLKSRFLCIKSRPLGS